MLSWEKLSRGSPRRATSIVFFSSLLLLSVRKERDTATSWQIWRTGLSLSRTFFLGPTSTYVLLFFKSDTQGSLAIAAPKFKVISFVFFNFKQEKPGYCQSSTPPPPLTGLAALRRRLFRFMAVYTLFARTNCWNYFSPALCIMYTWPYIQLPRTHPYMDPHIYSETFPFINLDVNL